MIDPLNRRLFRRTLGDCRSRNIAKRASYSIVFLGATATAYAAHRSCSWLAVLLTKAVEEMKEKFK